MRTFLTAITMSLFFSTAAFASDIPDSAYTPHQVLVLTQDCYKGPGIGLRYKTGIGGWVCTTDEWNNRRPRPETVSDAAEDVDAVIVTTEAIN